MHRVATDLEAVRYLLFRMSTQDEIEDTAFGRGKRQAVGCDRQRLEDIANTLCFRLWFTVATRYDLKYDATQMQLLTRPNLLRRVNAFAVEIGAVVAAQIADRDVAAKYREFRVKTGDGGIGKDDVALRISADERLPLAELDIWSRREPWIPKDERDHDPLPRAVNVVR
jgi:hypothetical protein